MAAFDGNGNYVRSYKWVNDASNGIDITASRFDTEHDGFAAALSNCLTRDGQGKISANFMPSSADDLDIGSSSIKWRAAYVTTINATTINGSLVIPQTAAEIAAGVVPVNYAYPEGVVNRYGNNTIPGTTDMTIPIQRAYLVSLAGSVPVILLAQTYYHTDICIHATNSAYGTVVRGVPLQSKFKHGGTGKPAIWIEGSQHFDIEGIVGVGVAGHKTQSILITKDGSGNRAAFGRLSHIMSCANGNGIDMQDCNTIDLDVIGYWPSGNNFGATADATNRANAISATGTGAVNSIHISNVNIGFVESIAGGGTGVLIGGHLSAAPFQDWKIDGLEAEVAGTRALHARNLNLGVFKHLFTENAEVRLDNGCVRVQISDLEAAATGTVVLDGTQPGGGNVQTLLVNCQAANLIADSANAQTMQINCNWPIAPGNADASIDRVQINVQGTGSVLQNDTLGNRGLAANGPLAGKRLTVSYSASMVINASLAQCFDIVATDGTAFTVQKPVNAIQDGQQITITIGNSSGGALGAVTWNAGYQMTAWTQPANGKYRAITFRFDSVRSAWDQISQTGTDITR